MIANKVREIVGGMQNNMEFHIGTVVSIDPVKVKLHNDDRILEDILVPKNLTKFEIEATTSKLWKTKQNGVFQELIKETPYPAYTTIEIDNSLKQGEVVFVISFDYGQKFAIHDRVGGA